MWGTTYPGSVSSTHCLPLAVHNLNTYRLTWNIKLWISVSKSQRHNASWPYPPFFLSQVRHLVMLMSLAISQTRASCGEWPGDEHVIMSDHIEAIDRTLFLSLCLSLCSLSLPLCPSSAGTPTQWYIFTRSQTKLQAPKTYLFACKQAHMELHMCSCKKHPWTCTRPQSFSVSRLTLCRSEWCRACGRLSLMETNVDTSHPRTCSQLTHCLIKVIYWFIYERLKVAIKWVHAALTLQSGLLLDFFLDFNGNNLFKHCPITKQIV